MNLNHKMIKNTYAIPGKLEDVFTSSSAQKGSNNSISYLVVALIIGGFIIGLLQDSFSL